MTDLALSTTTTTTPSGAAAVRRGVPSSLAAGLARGFTLGVLARAWMRLIAEDPAFTWGGTLFIVIGFTIFGFTQAVVSATYDRARTRWPGRVARVLGVVGMLPLFVAAGSIMLPTVVGGGLADARTEWPRWARAIGLVAAAGPLLLVGGGLVDSFGWSLHALAGFLAMVGVYVAIVRTARPTLMRPPLGKGLPVGVSIALVLVLAVFFFLTLVGGGSF